VNGHLSTYHLDGASLDYHGRHNDQKATIDG